MNILPSPRFVAAKPFASAHGMLPAIAIAALLTAALLLTACGGAAPALSPADSVAPTGTASAIGSKTTLSITASPTEPGRINLVAGNAVLADIASQVVSNQVAVNSLIPTGSDAHSWRSTPQDNVQIAEAVVNISHGTGLSAQVEELIEGTASPDPLE